MEVCLVLRSSLPGIQVSLDFMSSLWRTRRKCWRGGKREVRVFNQKHFRILLEPLTTSITASILPKFTNISVLIYTITTPQEEWYLLEWLRELNEKICMKGLMAASNITWQLHFQLLLFESIVLQVKTSFNNIFKILQVSKSKTTFRKFSWWGRKVNQCIFNLTRIFPEKLRLVEP